MTPNEVLVRPVVTEKSTLLQERGKYVFQVSRMATKSQIASSVEEVFDVAVVKVRTLRVRGKTKRYGRSVSRRPDWKKAIITLRAGDTIQLFEGA
jgi:large subunit ribosomal protein L23